MRYTAVMDDGFDIAAARATFRQRLQSRRHHRLELRRRVLYDQQQRHDPTN